MVLFLGVFFWLACLWSEVLRYFFVLRKENHVAKEFRQNYSATLDLKMILYIVVSAFLQHGFKLLQLRLGL